MPHFGIVEKELSLCSQFAIYFKLRLQSLRLGIVKVNFVSALGLTVYFLMQR